MAEWASRTIFNNEKAVPDGQKGRCWQNRLKSMKRQGPDGPPCRLERLFVGQIQGGHLWCFSAIWPTTDFAVAVVDGDGGGNTARWCYCCWNFIPLGRTSATLDVTTDHC